jgi:hypothetical protein
MDAKLICNLGLGKLGTQSRVANLDPPVSGVEKHCAQGYPTWRDSELRKHRWVFSRTFKQLTQANVNVPTTAERPYAYSLPSDYIFAVRYKTDTWQQRGQYVHTSKNVFVLEYHNRPSEAYFDPLFVDVLTCRVAMESMEFATQSRGKLELMMKQYEYAIGVASSRNAFIIDPEDLSVEDENDEWVLAREGRAGV